MAKFDNFMVSTAKLLGGIFVTGFGAVAVGSQVDHVQVIDQTTHVPLGIAVAVGCALLSSTLYAARSYQALVSKQAELEAKINGLFCVRNRDQMPPKDQCSEPPTKRHR